MFLRQTLPVALLVLGALGFAAEAAEGTARQGGPVTIGSGGVLVVGGEKVFPVALTMPPGPDAKAPNGRHAFAVLREAGVTFVRSGPVGKGWTAEALDEEKKVLDAAAKHGLRVMPFLRELGELPEGNANREKRLREVVSALKDHPAMGVWKGADEPEWGKVSPADVERAYVAIRQVDPNHPVWIVQAPRGTVASLKNYHGSYDIVGCDIYPVGYPPGMHSLGKNKEISMVGEYTRKMMEVSAGRKPVWMTLQIAWSGVTKPGKTLRMPTFEQERFMTYQAIINGARGIVYFGGHLPQAWNKRDRELGWNWSFWENVLERVVKEIGPESELGKALVVENSKIEVKASSPEVELCVREVGEEIYVIACKREGGAGEAVEVTFSGLPQVKEEGEVVYEDPRRVSVKGGQFKDWFGPFEVHVYRFRR